MTTKAKSRLSLDIDRELHRALKIFAAEQDTTLHDIATEALKDWLRRKEQEEDAAAIAEVINDERVRLDWDRYKADMELAAADEP